MTRKHKIVTRLLTLIISAMLVFAAGVSVNAEPLHNLAANALTQKYDDSINNSYISAERIFQGGSVLLHAAPKGVDPSKCTYSFSFRAKGFIWFTLSDFSDVQDYSWSPTTMGDYEVCIKIKFGQTIGRKFFNVRVSRELIGRPYISTSFIQIGNTVELSADHEGGYGNVNCAFYYKRKDEYTWSTLSGFGPADYIKWRPTAAGEYDICIKIADDDDQLKEGYYSLTVSETLPKTPTEFVITVRSPIASPYFWKCNFTDSDVLDYYVAEKPAALEDLKTYVILEYHFRTKAAGRTSIGLEYNTYNGEKYELSYDVTVDKNLNYTVNQSDGSYTEKQLPEPKQVTGSFSVSLGKTETGSKWSCEISDNLVADITKTDNYAPYEDTFSFKTYRKGSFTISFTCYSVTERKEKYKVFYDITVDDDLNASVFNKDGIYIDYTELPDIVQ